MNVVPLALKRSRAHLGYLVAIAAVTAIVTLLVSGVLGYLAAAAITGTRDTLASATASDAAVRVQTRLAGVPGGTDSVAQQAAADTLFTRHFAGTPTSWHRSLRTDPLDVQTTGPASKAQPAMTDASVSDSGPAARIILGSDPELPDIARLVDGSWPTAADGAAGAPSSLSPRPGALQADAARALGVSVGDTLVVGSSGGQLAVTIAATWLPTDARARVWMDDSAVLSGHAGADVGVLMLAEEDLAGLRTQPYVRWTIVPDETRVQPSQLAELASALGSLHRVTSQDPQVFSENVTVGGGLTSTLAGLRQQQSLAGGISGVAVVLVALIGAITLVQLSRLLAALRRPETAVLRARGASIAQLTVVGAVEALAVVVAGTVVGGGLAVGLFAGLGLGVVPRLGTGPLSEVSATPGTPWQGIVVIASVALLTITATGWRAATTASTGAATADETGRASRVTTLGATILAVIAAGLGYWQFRIYADASAAARAIDPVVVLAPAVVLVALAMLGLLFFGRVAQLAQLAAARSAGITPVLPSRQVARRSARFAIAVLLVTVSVGGATLAASYAATWPVVASDNLQFANGADMRVRFANPRIIEGPQTLVTGAGYQAIDHVTSAAPAVSSPARIGQTDIPFTAISAARLPELMSSVGGSVDTAALAETLSFAQPAIALPPDAQSIIVSVQLGTPSVIVAPDDGMLTVSVWVSDDSDALTRLALGSVAVGTAAADAQTGTVRLAAALPSGQQPWRVEAFEATLQTANAAARQSLTYTDVGYTTDDHVETSGTDETGTDETAADEANADEGASVWAGTLETQLTSDRPTVRTLAPAASRQPNGAAAGATTAHAVPVVVTTGLARLLSTKTGDRLSFVLPATGRPVAAVVIGTVPLIPGQLHATATDADLGMIADLGALNRTVLETGDPLPQPSEVWLATDTTDSATADAIVTAARVEARAPVDVTTSNPTSTTAVLGPAATALWVGMAGALLLAAVATWAITRALADERRSETLVLRALGLSGREQARMRIVEVAAVAGQAVLAGIIAGLVVSALTVTDLARMAVGGVPGPLPVSLHLEVAGWLGLLAALVAGLAIVSALYGARVRRQAEIPDASKGRP